MRHLLLTGLLLCAAASAPAATATLPPGAVLVDVVRAPEADVHAAALDATLAAGGDAAEVVQTLQTIADPLRREATAARLLDRLQRRGAAVPGPLLDALGAWPVSVWRRHEETAADWFLPVFDLPGRVQSVRLLQAREREVDALLAVLARKRADEASRSLAQAAPQVAALAVAAASPAVFDMLRAHAKSQAVAWPSPVLAAFARRAADADTFMHALDVGDPIDVLPLFAQTLPALPRADARTVLREALARPAYASVAAFALVRWSDPGDVADPLLRGMLATRDGGAAVAAALAQVPDALARIDALLASASDAATLGHLALALRLHGGPEAEVRLHALRGDARLSAAVRAELQR
ncbi:hypothetical protein [Chiayiivirga flava]|uniref:DUF2336 domain-containing protein n=1 Tax=Chiayiivirga flava TaxID=659595 RepID=A0A7W8D4Q9_9GAMM|nr:hypothetical protein [Chiayiivirga flava]MBB5206760.1 hypothetical protein [Chiayiivirga flava]